uniref:Cysteine-rich and transmembrane domain-containing protein 1 n=1 Tax=Phasianus colchicus TaxID=9054 RepID=A0A669QZJ0_PHACC
MNLDRDIEKGYSKNIIMKGRLRKVSCPHPESPGQVGAMGCHEPPAAQGGGQSPALGGTMYVVEERRRDDSGESACLTACWTALCCCCLWDMLT